MQGKHVLITGANSGIGLSTAKLLAQKSAKISILVRNKEKGEATIQAIKETAPEVDMDYFIADLSKQKDIRNAVAEFKQKYNNLDVLVNNAGAYYSELKFSEDNIEMQWAINHLAPFLLTHLLLDELKAAEEARVVNVSSNAHRRGTIQFEDLYHEKSYQGFKVYCQNKLGNVLFTKALAKRLKGSSVTVNALHPGVVKTDIAMKHDSGLAHWFWKLAKPFMSSLEKGAATSVYLSSSPEVLGVSGGFFDKCKEVKPGRSSNDEAVEERLYQLSLKQCNLSPIS